MTHKLFIRNQIKQFNLPEKKWNFIDSFYYVEIVFYQYSIRYFVEIITKLFIRVRSEDTVHKCGLFWGEKLKRSEILWKIELFQSNLLNSQENSLNSLQNVNIWPKLPCRKSTASRITHKTIKNRIESIPAKQIALKFPLILQNSSFKILITHFPDKKSHGNTQRKRINLPTNRLLLFYSSYLFFISIVYMFSSLNYS